MLAARSIFNEIRGDDRAYQLLLSVAAKGETQGGWENQRIALLTRDRELAAKIRRHGEDESKHGRLFTALLKKRIRNLGDARFRPAEHWRSAAEQHWPSRARHRTAGLR